MKKSMLIVLIVLCALLLASCCKHEVWNDADCETPKTCAECGETEGEPLGHTWVDASCETPKTCSVCQKTEGAALGHSWADATCEAPKTCQSCSLTEGEALGHTWEDATTEAPKTCTVCAKTEGERIITDARFTTAACKPLFGRWEFSMQFGGDMMEMEGFTGYLDVNFYMDFSNDGKLTTSVEAKECDDFDTLLTQYMVDLFYKECSAQGVGKAAADAEMKASYGVTTEEYFETVAKSVDFAAMINDMSEEGVYYVNGDTLYTADTWKKNMNAAPFRFEGETLIVEGITESLGVAEGSFTRVPDSET